MVKNLVLATVFVCLVYMAPNSHGKEYKGAEIYTKAVFQYGRFSARIRAAEGSGLLSTLFTYKSGSEKAGVDWEEIDIEIFGKGMAQGWQSNVITGGDKLAHAERVHLFDKNASRSFHTVAIEWTPGSVRWLVDGVEVRRAEGASVKKLKSPQSLRSNIWISDSPSWVGSFDSSVLPVFMLVDWIEVYSWEDGAFEFLWRDEFSEFDETRWSKAAWTFPGNKVDFDPRNVQVKDGMLVLSVTREEEVGALPDIIIYKDDALGSRIAGESVEALQNYVEPNNRVTLEDLEDFE